MSEIKVGEYVRTINGEIGIFKGYNANSKSQWKYRIEFQKVKTWKYCAECYILKHSKDIIDLIEVGDYVNGREVKHIAMFEGFPDYPKLIFVDEKHLLPSETAENEDIKSIVTKEQFESIKYEVN